MQPAGLGDLIESAELPGGVRVHAFRDGMFAFALGPGDPDYEDDFLAWNRRCLRLMNAHLACLHAAIGPPFIFSAAVATAWNTMQVAFESGEFEVSSGGIVMALYGARTQSPMAFDWRFRREGPLENATVTAEHVQRSFDLLRELLNRPAQEAVLLRAELLLRAWAAFSDLDYSGALTNAWTAIEGMLGDMMGRYLDETEDRPVPRDASGNKMSFMPGKRRRFFEGAEMTSRHVMECLSLLDRLPFPMYQAAVQCARARNNWLHSERAPSDEDAWMALKAAGDLFELAEGVPLRLAT